MLKLLLPTDFSPQNRVMYQLVQQLSYFLPVHATLLHLSPHKGRGYESERQQLEAALNRTATGDDNWFARCTTDTALMPRKGSVPLQIANYADTGGYDLILTASKPRGGMTEYLMSSTLSRIIRYSNVPVLVLSPGKLPRLGRFLFTTDFSPESMRALVLLMRTTRKLKATVVCARINTQNDFITERDFQEARQLVLQTLALNDLDQLPADVSFVSYNDVDVPTGILNAAQDHLTDVVVQATNARSGFSLLMNGSVTQQVIERTHLPVLVYKIARVDALS